MPTRRTFLIATTLGLGAHITRPRAELGNRMMRVGAVEGVGRTDPDAVRYWAVFDQEMRERGWVEGRSIVIERRNADGDFARLPAMVAELLVLNVDVIISGGPPATLAAKQATDRIPIVFWVSDPVRLGIVASLAHPGGNATGISRQVSEMLAKRVELLQVLSPQVTRVAVLTNPDVRGLPRLDQQPMPRGIEVFLVHVRGADDLGPAFAALAKRRADAVVVEESATNIRYLSEILEAITRVRLPAIAGMVDFVERGGLLSYRPDSAVLMRQVAIYVDKILRGARPADLPVQQPNAFEIALNLKTAKALGITIPRELIVRADRIVE